MNVEGLLRILLIILLTNGRRHLLQADTAADNNVIHVRLGGSRSRACWTGGEKLPCNSILLALSGLQICFNSTNTTIVVHGPDTHLLPANNTATVVSGAQNVYSHCWFGGECGP